MSGTLLDVSLLCSWVELGKQRDHSGCAVLHAEFSACVLHELLLWSKAGDRQNEVA